MTTDIELFGLSSASIKIERENTDQEFSLYLQSCNSFFLQLTGLTPDTKNIDSKSILGPNFNEYLSVLHGFQINKLKDRLNVHFLSTDKWVQINAVPDESSGLAIIALDISEFQNQISSFNIQKEGYMSYIKNFHGIAFQKLLKPEEKYIFSAGAYEEITGYSSEEIQDYQAWSALIHPEDKKRIEKEASVLYRSRNYQNELEYRIIRKDGSIGWVHSYDGNFFSEDRKIQMAQGLIVDVTKQKEQELDLKQAYSTIREQNRKLEGLALTDPLTALSNRRSVMQILDFLYDDYKRTGEIFSIFMFDLDNFKFINDTYGHDAGDIVLLKIAEILQNNLRNTDIKSRWGGEEFLVLLPHTDVDIAYKISLKILSIFRETLFKFNETSVSVTFSGGICSVEDKKTPPVLIKNADTALYKAKSEGRNCIVIHR